jgi:hypothetical protein
VRCSSRQSTEISVGRSECEGAEHEAWDRRRADLGGCRRDRPPRPESIGRAGGGAAGASNASVGCARGPDWVLGFGHHRRLAVQNGHAAQRGLCGPLNAEGTKVANAWDRAKDIAAGEQCRAFGAAGIMRLPVRLHITWQDDRTLKVDIDNGQQTRLFRFDLSSQPPAQRDWQGISVAQWETVQQGQAIVSSDRGADREALSQPSGSLKVQTSNMRPGYLRRNGVPYSANAALTEFFDRTTEANGDSWLILTAIVDDPAYLNVPFMLTTHYKREADGAKFSPRPCEETPPVTGVAQ